MASVMSVDEFYLSTLGKIWEMDGVPVSDPHQCADYFKKATYTLLGYHWPTGGDGYVDYYWINRYSQHPEAFYFIDDWNQFRNGDFVIWGNRKRTPGTVFPLSHIAMYYNHKMVGMNQMLNGVKHKDVVAVPVTDSIWANALGALRFKVWAGGENMLDLQPGKRLFTTYENQKILVIPQYPGTKIGLVSAKEPNKPYSLSRQLIQDIDVPGIKIMAKINANYFIMSGSQAGQHLGVRVGFGEEWEIPKQNAYWWFAERSDGDTDVGLDVQWPYNPGEVKMAYSPALINYRRGMMVNYVSPNAAASKAVPNSQSMLIRTSSMYIFAMAYDGLTPAQCRTWALNNIPGVLDVMFNDSGGSSCIQDQYSTYYAKGKREIADALVMYEPNEPVQPALPEKETNELEDLLAKNKELLKTNTDLLIEISELKTKIKNAQEALK